MTKIKLRSVLLLCIFPVFTSGCLGGTWEQVCDMLPRPQEPKDRPYAVHEVTVDGGEPGVRLAGEFTFPTGEGPFPGAVLISGSELVDRDSSILGHKFFLVLADYLTRHGFAVFRHDDRGYGQSTGDSYTALDTDFAADSAAALRWMRSQPQIDAGRVGFIGHSQGGFKGPIAAQMEEPNFMIFLAGGIQTTARTLLQQTHDLGKLSGLSEEDLDTQSKELKAIFEILRSSADTEEAKRRVIAFATGNGASKKQASQLAENYATPWLIAELKRGDDMYAEIDAEIATLIKSYDLPILALYGEKDLLVSAAINAPLTEPLLTHPKSKVMVFENLNHFFQPAETGSIEETCEIETTIDASALSAIGNWLNSVMNQ